MSSECSTLIPWKSAKVKLQKIPAQGLLEQFVLFQMALCKKPKRKQREGAVGEARFSILHFNLVKIYKKRHEKSKIHIPMMQNIFFRMLYNNIKKLSAKLWIKCEKKRRWPSFEYNRARGLCLTVDYLRPSSFILRSSNFS